MLTNAEIAQLQLVLRALLSPIDDSQHGGYSGDLRTSVHPYVCTSVQTFDAPGPQPLAAIKCPLAP